MRSKDFQRRKAMELRKQGRSLSEIADSLHVSKSSISIWVRGVRLSADAKGAIERKREDARALSAHTHKARTAKKIEDARVYGASIVREAQLRSPENKILCALLYWCEGTKLRKGSYFAFTNSDPKVVQLFLDLFRKNFPVDESKFRLSVHLHTYHDAAAQLQFWSKLTTIPLAQCQKPHQKLSRSLRIREGYMGCASVKYFDIALARRIEGIAKAFFEKTGPIV